MNWNIDITPEDENEMISNIAKKIHKSGMEVAALFMIESMKPFAFIGNQMGRFFISPFLPIFGEDMGLRGENFFKVFEKYANVEKLIKAIEALKREEEEQKKVEKAKKLETKSTEIEESAKKNGWWRFLPF